MFIRFVMWIRCNFNPTPPYTCHTYKEMKWADFSLQHATLGRRLCNGELTYGLIVQRQFGNVTTDWTVCREGDGHRDERHGHGSGWSSRLALGGKHSLWVSAAALQTPAKHQCQWTVRPRRHAVPSWGGVRVYGSCGKGVSRGPGWLRKRRPVNRAGTAETVRAITRRRRCRRDNGSRSSAVLTWRGEQWTASARVGLSNRMRRLHGRRTRLPRDSACGGDRRRRRVGPRRA